MTTSGKPILANDPHLEMQSPSIWYLAEIKAPGLDVIGATMPGMPGVVIGHNQKIAWGVTNVNPNTQDLYIIPSQLQNQIQSHSEKIKVRGGQNVNFNVSTFQGLPIISSVTDTSQISSNVALKWTAFDKSDKTTQSILEIDAAHDWQTFTEALQDFDTPSQNFVYADIKGNIGYYLSGKIPIRHWESHLPVPFDQNHQWSGYIPFNELPHVYNPPEGFVASANNLVVTSHYPYQINFRWVVPPFRIERITNLIQEYKPLDISKNILIQQDTHSLLWKSLSKRLIQTKPLDKDCEIGLNYLKNWSGETDLNSIPSTIFAYWYQQMDLLMPDFLRKQSSYPEPLFVFQQININDPKAEEFLSKSLQAAMRKCINDLGHDPKNWEWKNIHQAKFSELGIGSLPGINLIWNRSIPTSGSLYTVNAGTYNAESFLQNDGASYRQIIDLSDLNHSLFVTTLGQSNDPFSKNYDDQLPLWQKGKYLSMSTDPKDWKSQRELVLEPQ